MSWIEKLKNRWNLKNTAQVVVVLIVFACTGMTVLLIKPPLTDWVTEGGTQNSWFRIVYYILILPVYNVLLLMYGFIFGQFKFFWEFEKRTFRRLTGRKANAEQK